METSMEKTNRTGLEENDETAASILIFVVVSALNYFSSNLFTSLFLCNHLLSTLSNTSCSVYLMVVKISGFARLC